MISAAILALLLAQATPSPSPSACPPTEVTRVGPKSGIGDPEYHGQAKCYGIACTIEEVLVTVNADGTVKNAVVKGTWGPDLDEEALRNARNSIYKPKTLNCKPVEGTYVFREIWLITH